MLLLLLLLPLFLLLLLLFLLPLPLPLPLLLLPRLLLLLHGVILPYLRQTQTCSRNKQAFLETVTAMTRSRACKVRLVSGSCDERAESSASKGV